jgi:hypothetical protein
MQASKVSINPNFIKFENMSPGKRAQLRRQNIIDLIRSKAAGTFIPMSEFQAVTQHKKASGAWSLIQGMIKAKIISRVPIDGTYNKYSYVVNEDVKTIKSAVTSAAPTEMPSSMTASTSRTRTTVETPQKSLTSYAREFAWESNSDSLRDFIKWMDGKELDLRRMISGEAAD